MRNGGRVLLAVLNFYIRIKIRVATFDTLTPLLIARRHSAAASIQKISDSVVKLFGRAGYIYSRRVGRNWISFRLAVDFLRVMYLKIHYP